jgi:flagellar assembly protein FliH
MVRIIKAAEAVATAPPHARGQGAFIDASHDVHCQLEHARAHAARIVDEARQQAEQIRQEAERQGRGQGQQQADAAHQDRVRSEVQRQLASALPALEQAVEAVREARAGHLRQCEAGLIRLASAIAARLVRRQLQQTPEIALDLVREALELATGSQQLKIRLHPSDYDALGPCVAELARRHGESVTAELIADADVSRGGCVLQTEFGTIDQRFESQLARIIEELS